MTGVWNTSGRQIRIVNDAKYTRILGSQYPMSKWYGAVLPESELHWTKIAPSHLTVWKE